MAFCFASALLVCLTASATPAVAGPRPADGLIAVLDGPDAPQAAPVPFSEPPAADADRSDGKPKSLGLEGDRRRAVDELLGRLAKTDDEGSAKRIAAAVQALWLRSGSDTVDLLTARATEAQRAQKLDMAVKLMDEVVSLRPDYAEGWNRRATLRFMAKEFDEAMSDIRETLIREPRHFGAWVGLGRILADTGYDRQALGAYRKALEIYPAIEGLKKQVEDLTLKVEGQPI